MERGVRRTHILRVRSPRAGPKGEAEDGYEQVRSLDAIASEHGGLVHLDEFEMHSDEHREWLAAVGSI